MNRYRTLPGLGPAKATAATTCQKCLKKDIYECKAGAQDRPYTTRPSRTQQLLNPSLKPRLTADFSNTLTQRDGIADEQLARVRAEREQSNRGRSQSPVLNDSKPAVIRHRSVSSESVATISTARSPSRSRSPPQRRERRRSRRRSRSESKDRPVKRKHRVLSESSSSRSPPRYDRAIPNKNRRYNGHSPEDRGRSAIDRRGSHRSRSDSNSYDRSEATKFRRSLDPLPNNGGTGAGVASQGISPRNHRGRPMNDSTTNYRSARSAPRKERSLSPYSRRLALTQAMNMGR